MYTGQDRGRRLSEASSDLTVCNWTLNDRFFASLGYCMLPRTFSENSRRNLKNRKFFCWVVGLDGRCSVQAEQRKKPAAVVPLPGAYLSTETNFVPIRGVTRKEFDTGHTHAIKAPWTARSPALVRTWPPARTRSLAAVEPRRPPEKNVGTETAFGHDNCKHNKKIKYLWGQRSVDLIKLAYIFNNINLHAQCHGFLAIRNHFRGQSSCGKFGHTGCWSIAKCIRSQRSRRNTGVLQSWPPTTCRFSTRRSFDHHVTVIFYKTRVRKEEKKAVPLNLKVMKTRNDFKIACDSVKRANVVLHVGLSKEIFARKDTATQKATSAQPLIVTTLTLTC